MKTLNQEQKTLLKEGTVIPAIPLALTEERHFDEKRQRRLARYYVSTGTGGMAVAVHSTQFEIRDPEINLFETVIRVVAEEIDKAAIDRPFVKVAGICGPTSQAIQEAELALKYGYDMGLLSMGGLQGWTEEEILKRTREIAKIIPLFGFYLQPSVGGRIFSYDFWSKFAEIENVEAIKAAPFNRYQTFDVMRAVSNSSRRDEIAMYTGNDDNIVGDLLATYRFTVDGKPYEKSFVGGMLGHWAVWTKKAVDLLEEIKAFKVDKTVEKYEDLQKRGIEITDTNAALFDPANHFHGCIPGIHEVLRRQGLLEGRWCLNPNEELSPGQMEEIDRVYREYPHLNDDEFVKAFLEKEGELS